MIAGTTFQITEPTSVAEACLARGRRFGLTVSEIAEIQAECEADRAACLVCEDGVLVITLCSLNDPHDGFEMYVLLAVAFQHGAFERQDSALLAIARDLGADAIAFRARRRGWARRLGPEWHRRGTDEFVRAV